MSWANFTIEGRSFHVKSHRVFAVGQQVAQEVDADGKTTGVELIKTCITVDGLGTVPIDETVAEVAAILEAASDYENESPIRVTE